jgi:hypothetical protein
MLESEDYMRFLDDARKLSLQEPYDRFLGWVGCLGVRACTSVEGVVAANPVSGVERVVAGFAVQAVSTAATSPCPLRRHDLEVVARRGWRNVRWPLVLY